MILERGQNRCHKKSLHGRTMLEMYFEFFKSLFFLSDLEVLYADILAEGGMHFFSAFIPICTSELDCFLIDVKPEQCTPP